MNIAVIGLGLIGASFCKAIKARTEHTCYGMDTNGQSVEKALADGSIDFAITNENIHLLSVMDITIIGLHPRTAIQFVLDNLQHFSKGSIVTDTCGIKTSIVDALEDKLQSRGVHFIGAHPMAGREFSGYDYSLATLFDGASFIVTPTQNTDSKALETVTELARRIGFGKIATATPEKHDRIIAYTSQLAHVVSNAYVKSETLLERSGFSAGSFLDLTRVARLNEHMWTELFMDNKAPLLQEIDTILANIKAYRDALANGDEATLKNLLRVGRELKEESMKHDVNKRK